MKNANKFDEIEGLIIGGMTSMRSDQYFSTINDVIDQLLDSLPNKKFPVAWNINVGHIPINIAILNGAQATMIVSNENSQILFE